MRDRTADLLHAMQALSQLSYTPEDRGTAGTGRNYTYKSAGLQSFFEVISLNFASH